MAAADLIELIIERAVDLRRAGVVELSIEGLGVKLAPYVDPDAPVVTTAEVEDLAPLDDPESYGLPPGSPVPGFPALRDRRRSES